MTQTTLPTLPRIYISAAHKSSGKTTLSLGLCAALTRLRLNIQPFKKGPDYIDPLWLGAASQATCYNLDFNTMSNDEILHKLDTKSRDKDFALIEGNMGLYDGTDLEGTNSNASMAKLTNTPVILVIDAQGVTRGVAPLLLGYQRFDSDITIAGVIFNKIAGARHQKKLINVTEHYTDIPVLGCVRRSKDLILVERHLGLMPYNESDKANTKVSRIADKVQEQIDLDKVLAVSQASKSVPNYHFSDAVTHTLASSPQNPEQLTNKSTRESISQSANCRTKSLGSDPLPSTSLKEQRHQNTFETMHSMTQDSKLTIGLCKDAAFGFYYTDDIEALQQAGADIVTINTLHDQKLPAIDALFIGGGFPETQMQALSDNQSLRHEIYKAIESGMPVYAECGGLMYLSESLTWETEHPGKSFPMVGIIPAKTIMQKKPQGRGYVTLNPTQNMPWLDKSEISLHNTISAHEFHYSRLEDTQGQLTQKGSFAYAVDYGFGIDGEHDGWLYKNLLASYSHMRDTSKYHWAEHFVAFIRQVNNQKQDLNKENEKLS